MSGVPNSGTRLAEARVAAWNNCITNTLRCQTIFTVVISFDCCSWWPVNNYLVDVAIVYTQMKLAGQHHGHRSSLLHVASNEETFY